MRIKREQEELKNEELRQKVGKVLWSTRQFQIKYVDVKVVEDLIQGSWKRKRRSPAISSRVAKG